ncbi:MAG: succinate dehydrogenase, cytochrome b556 subunit [Nevskia sp.]
MSAKPSASNRPLSPFMIGPYYRPQLTSMLSITHRLTGLALAIGTVFLTAWVTAAASGPSAYATFSALANSIVGRLLLVAFTWSLVYHLCNGIRHLFWDAGRGFELKTAYASGYAVVAASVVLTAGLWIAAFAF